MTSSEETSLILYKSQLSQVELSLEENPSNADLLELKQDLSQLISLTKSSLLEVKKQELLKSLEDESERPWEGRRVQAPFRVNGSPISYHNGIVFDENGPTVTVVFSNPITHAMRPCQHFMNAGCKFEGKCKYSHGETVEKEDLRDFIEPDYSLLTHGTASVLAQSPETDLWVHAQTLQPAADNMVLLEFRMGNDRIRSLPLEHIFPLEAEEPSTNSDPAPIDILDIIQPTSTALGAWEQHTKGIGSKLMSKMGYIFGSGLGKEAQGIVEPVPCTLYPAGKSLDYCMEQRDKVKVMGEAVIKPKASKKTPTKPRKNLFDFINKSITSSSSDQGERPKEGSQKTKSESDLKIENFKLTEDISKAEMEVQRLSKSLLKYVKTDPVTAKGIQSKIDAHKGQLAVLQSRVRGIQKEQGSRSDRKKLSIF